MLGHLLPSQEDASQKGQAGPSHGTINSEAPHTPGRHRIDPLCSRSSGPKSPAGHSVWSPPRPGALGPEGHARRARAHHRDGQVPFFSPRIHMVSSASISVRPRPNHSLKDLVRGFSSSWPQANLRYPAHAWRKASTTAFWRSFWGAGRRKAGCGHPGRPALWPHSE